MGKEKVWASGLLMALRAGKAWHDVVQLALTASLPSI